MYKIKYIFIENKKNCFTQKKCLAHILKIILDINYFFEVFKSNYSESNFPQFTYKFSSLINQPGILNNISQ